MRVHSGDGAVPTIHVVRLRAAGNMLDRHMCNMRQCTLYLLSAPWACSNLYLWLATTHVAGPPALLQLNVGILQHGLTSWCCLPHVRRAATMLRCVARSCPACGVPAPQRGSSGSSSVQPRCIPCARCGGADAPNRPLGSVLPA